MRALVAVVLVGCAYHSGHAPTDGQGPPEDALFDASSLDVSTGWWDPAWMVRRQLTIANGSQARLPVGFQVGFGIELDGAPCSAANRDGARIVRDNVEMPRVVEEIAGASEWIWFPLAVPIESGSSSSEYWLYCKNAAPTVAPKDPHLVFDLFDDFTGGVNAAVWATQGTVVASTGGITIAGAGAGTGNSALHSVATFGAGHAVDFIAKVMSAAAPDFWAGFQDGFPDQPPWLHWYAHAANVIAPDYWGDMTGVAWYGTNHTLDTMPHLYSVENYGTSSMYRFEDLMTEQHVYEVPPTPAQLNVRLHNNSATNKVEYRMARVRKASNPPPLVTVGLVEME